MGVFNNFLIISKLTSLEYKAVHRTKLFGILWKFLNPLLFIGVYTFVFSTLYPGGSRGYVISMGILLFSGISTSINSCTTWVQPKILSFASSPKKLKLLFFSKIYFNFIPIFYLIPVLVFVQRIIFNIDFKFSLLESVEILIQVYLLTIFVMFYCFIVCVPIAIISKRLTDLKDLINHLLRIALNKKIISISLRKRVSPKLNFDLKLVKLKREDPTHKNLKYKKILSYLSKMDNSKSDIGLVSNKKLLETGTSNLLFVKNNKIYSAKNKYYRGVNLKFYEKKFNIIKKDIYLKELNQFDEILLVGSGKGVVSTSYIVDSNWKRRKSKIFNSMYKTFEKEFKKEKYIYN